MYPSRFVIHYKEKVEKVVNFETISDILWIWPLHRSENRFFFGLLAVLFIITRWQIGMAIWSLYLFPSYFSWEISAGADGGPRSWVCEHLTLCLGACVCKVTFKHFLQPLRSHIQIFRTLGQLFKSHSAGGRGCPK